MTSHEFDEYIPALKRYSLSLTKSREQAEDLLQDTLMRVLAKGTDTAELHKPERYMCSVMHNLYIDEMRRQSRDGQPVSLDLVEPIDNTASQSLRLTCQQTMAAIARLPKPYAEVLVRHACQGQSYTEISKALGIPHGTVMSRISRARAALCKTLHVKAGLDLLEQFDLSLDQLAGEAL